MTAPSAPHHPDPASADETSGRFPILLLFASAILWLVIAGVLGLIGSIQAHSPDFLADCPFFTFGRIRSMSEAAFVYGWLGNAGLGVALWILARLSGAPLPAPSLAGCGAAFWNLGLALGLACIAAGDGTSLPLLGFPRYVMPLLLVSHAAIGVSGVLAWSRRKRPVMYASQSYAAAALFLFPWLFSAAQSMLLWIPVRGVVQAVVSGWYVQGVWTFWIAPMALAGAYYLKPKLTGRPVPSYGLAPIGFWCLIAIGALTGGRHLIGGPVPAWISTVGIAASIAVLFHYIVVAVNLSGPRGGPGVSLGFLSFGVGAYVLDGAINALTSVRSVAVATQFTAFDEGERQLALFGAASMILFALLYYAVPKLAGRPLFSAPLQRAHFVVAAIGAILLIGGLAIAGSAQGSALNDPAVAFSDIAVRVRPGLLSATAGQMVVLFGDLLLLVNFFKTAACPFYAAEAARTAGEARAT